MINISMWFEVVVVDIKARRVNNINKTVPDAHRSYESLPRVGHY